MIEDNDILFISNGDDFIPPTNSEKFEMDDVLQNYKLEKKARKIVSLTPTNYKIKKIKI